MLLQAISGDFFDSKIEQELYKNSLIPIVLTNLLKNIFCALGALGLRFKSYRPDQL
ncbi:hypothetical protein [Prochlorococcus marinus]|uniref:hypothetical protein n=1 Tax=Prochlorococcus marinus TaxID=1219 RepID=UPI001ADADBBE|nr:hypothetical protein [Prochlorococcus marinus]MBO8219386.1 hypothetical protein [Prochlorococcus marinus CUG1416]